MARPAAPCAVPASDGPTVGVLDTLTAPADVVLDRLNPTPRPDVPIGRNDLPTLARYRQHLNVTASWLVASVRRGGGSSAYYSTLAGWSAPYPETTGYLIPTLLALRSWVDGVHTDKIARELGEWLLRIQMPDGSWCGGVHRTGKHGKASVFNTAQVLRGLAALYRATGHPKWVATAHRAATWLAGRVDGQGLWPASDYKSPAMPAYYSYAASALLDVGLLAGDGDIRAAAERVLDAVVRRRRENGAFAGWAFAPAAPAFTHTIAYTLQGLIESAEMLADWPRYGAPTEKALEVLLRRVELSGGALRGRYTEEWRPAARSMCLTGNAQVALCFIAWDRRERDLRIVNATAKLVDSVCSTQRLRGATGGTRGAVAGSWPVWGRYMALRYPNWSAKYHCDALMALSHRIGSEA